MIEPGLVGDQSVPLLQRNDYNDASIFRPEVTLREARRQMNLRSGPVPPICILDPDGDLVEYARTELGATCSRDWGCFHTRMWEWQAGQSRIGIIGHAVGASFAVLCAEQAFASGCQLLISITSAGQLRAVGTPPYHIVIERALRDEGTSYHYLPPSKWAGAEPTLVDLAVRSFAALDLEVHRCPSWTTDAPYRETEQAIASRVAAGAVVVEMEAAALYAFSQATGHPVLCIAHVTNSLDRADNDFEKGHHNGARASLDLIEAFVGAWLRQEVAVPVMI